MFESKGGRVGRKLFGTDGVRGVANTDPMTVETVMALGQAIAYSFRNLSGRHKIVIGKDTRLSGYMFETALAAGICSMGGDVLLVGPLPTPQIGRAHRIDDAPGRYIVYLKNTFPGHLSLEGMRIVIDCAHGAAYRIAPQVFQELGANVLSVGVSPNGLHLHDKCGCLYPELVSAQVKEHRADLGISLDGDADRVIVVGPPGTVVDGDRIMAICAEELARRKKLKKNTVVATVMSNIGLELFLRERKIRMVRGPVGDRYVVEAMRAGGYKFGGEQSGHMIFLY